MEKKKLFKIAIPVACAAAVFACVTALPKLMEFDEQKPVDYNIAVSVPAQDSPSGIRKTMNYNGYRYAFIENGTAYDLDKNILGEELGKLEYDIVKDTNKYGSADFAGTFAIGGTIHTMNNYSPDFRVAVKHEDKYYICENVDILGGADVNMKEYFEKADFAEKVESIAVNDHMGMNLLREFSKDDSAEMVSLLAESTPVKLSNDQYQEIGTAQREGESFFVSFRLNDGTEYRFYLIPSMSIAMFGDNKYTLSDEFTAEYGSIFAELPRNPIPMN